MEFPSGAQHSPDYIGVPVSPPEQTVSIPSEALSASFLVEVCLPSTTKKLPLVHKNKRDSVDRRRLGQQDNIRQPSVRPSEPAQIALSALRDFPCGRYRCRPLVKIAVSAKHKRGSVDHRRLGQQHDRPQPTVRAPQPAQTAAMPMPNANGTRPVTIVAPPQTSADDGGAQHVEAGRGAGIAPSPAFPRSAPTTMTRRNEMNAGAGSGFVSPSAGMSTLGRK